jgi:hypothetical protein
MSETPIIYMPELQGRLTDREIENKVTEAEKRGDFDLWNEELTNPTTPPIWEGPEFRHDTVQSPAAPRLETQPSIIDQNEAMTHQQGVEYVGKITAHLAKYRSDYVLTA